jgi:hypothetical protein
MLNERMMGRTAFVTACADLIGQGITMRFAVTLLIPLGSLALGADKPADDAKKLEGNWAVVWRAYDGPRSEDVYDLLTAQEYTVAIKGGVFEITRARDGYPADLPLTLKVDGSKKPSFPLSSERPLASTGGRSAARARSAARPERGCGSGKTRGTWAPPSNPSNRPYGSGKD